MGPNTRPTPWDHPHPSLSPMGPHPHTPCPPPSHPMGPHPQVAIGVYGGAAVQRISLDCRGQRHVRRARYLL